MILAHIVWIPLPEPVGKGKITWSVLICLFRPYFLPESNEATGHRRRQILVDFYRSNRVRAAATWICVGITWLANLYSPLLLGKAGKNLSNGKYADASINVAAYGLFNIVGHMAGQAQGLIYLTVAQSAFVEISEEVFGHLHALSLDWHLQKKLGEVMR
eukprot:CAMPEP_0194295610 /NCGR_PEP_ID=MMETSP0169-20130528/53933_1 /TAXON_ID=218684 /ORGANISM="Corethron pennatum, Strain L29A3" /LENGTH=158 /DNA_ID=CAMNT_0039044827 /DNA_START=277 /DNA_END=749 /DNA_ORIENTATION=+